MSDADPARNEGVAVERADVPPRLVAALAAGLAAFLFVAIVAIMLIYPSALHGLSDAPRLVTLAPRLQIDPARDLQAYRAAQQQQLDKYGWLDRRRGLVRIPIDQAMRDVAAAGIKDWP
jgi:hypothetical protein